MEEREGVPVWVGEVKAGIDRREGMGERGMEERGVPLMSGLRTTMSWDSPWFAATWLQTYI